MTDEHDKGKAQGLKPNSLHPFYGPTKSRALIQSKNSAP